MDSVKLYHGSRNGIKGDIQPKSRNLCDFGTGFYMGTKPEQVKDLVFNEMSPVFYTLNLHLENIAQQRILILSDMDWAFFVLYNRGMLKEIKNTAFYQKLAGMDRDKDIIIGPIADDNMTMVMQQFTDGLITDKTFMECIRCIDYGMQYVAKTERACKQVEILRKENIDTTEPNKYQERENERRRENNRKLKKTRREYRGQGRYLDEILEEYQKQNSDQPDF